MRSLSMQSLTDAIKRRHPGVVIYGVGDAAHKLRTSDHNEDDTAGSRAAQSDADSTPEHRAIDVMLGPAFTEAQAYDLIADLLADPSALVRLFYIIFDGSIWSRSNGWVRRDFDGEDQHRDHPHISGWAADDENAAGWPAVDGGDMFCKKGDRGEAVKRVQLGLLRLEPGCLGKAGADGIWGDTTSAALKRILGGDGTAFNAELDLRLVEALARRVSVPGPAGPAGRDGAQGAVGPAGPEGPAGRDGVVPDGATFVMQAPGGVA